MNIKATKELLNGVVEDLIESKHLYEENLHKSNLLGDFHFGLTYCIDILTKLERTEKQCEKLANKK